LKQKQSKCAKFCSTDHDHWTGASPVIQRRMRVVTTSTVPQYRYPLHGKHF